MDKSGNVIPIRILQDQKSAVAVPDLVVSMSDDEIAHTVVTCLRLRREVETHRVFLGQLLDPEGFGLAVSDEVRWEARRILEGKHE